MGVVKDPTGSVVPGAKVNLRNPVTGYEQNTVTDSAGAYRFNNIPQNNYRLTAEAPGFAPTSRTIDVRSSLPIVADISLDLLANIHRAQRDRIGGHWWKPIPPPTRTWTGAPS